MDGGLSLRKPPDSLKGRAYSLRPAPERAATLHRIATSARPIASTNVLSRRGPIVISVLQLSGTRIIASTGSVAATAGFALWRDCVSAPGGCNFSASCCPGARRDRRECLL